MDENVRRTIVISAVNIRKGGTLTILRQHLAEMSEKAGQFRIVALVHDRKLCDYPGIEYIELPWCTKMWILRLWAEYMTMHRISRKIARQDGHIVWKWISLHDTTPRVIAEHREVYCQTSFPFLKLRFTDLFADPKIVMFKLMTGLAYRINSRYNDCMIVQQEWFRQALSKRINYPIEKIKVQQPAATPLCCRTEHQDNSITTFLYPSIPDCHKNFEILCKATQILEDKLGLNRFKVIITVKGNENRYAKGLFKRWGNCSSIDFHGLMSRDELFSAYASADCLVFASRIETWGLPISEFLSVQPQGRMILADLPYAYETSGLKGQYFNPDSAKQLAALMRNIIIPK